MSHDAGRRATPPCFSCVHFQGLYDMTHAICYQTTMAPRLQPRPWRGCTQWRQAPGADLAVTTSEQYVALHGTPVPGFTDQRTDAWPSPLLASAIRQAYERHRHPEVRALVMEISRLHHVLFWTCNAMELMLTAERDDRHRRLQRLLVLLRKEPEVRRLKWRTDGKELRAPSR